MQTFFHFIISVWSDIAELYSTLTFSFVLQNGNVVTVNYLNLIIGFFAVFFITSVFYRGVKQ